MAYAIPYQLVYGQVPQVGISFLPLAPVILDSLHTEAQYSQAFLSVNGYGREASLQVQVQDDVHVDGAVVQDVLEAFRREADHVDDVQPELSLSNTCPALGLPGLNYKLVTFVLSIIYLCFVTVDSNSGPYVYLCSTIVDAPTLQDVAEDLRRVAEHVDDAPPVLSLSNTYPAFAGLNLMFVTFVLPSICVL